MKEENNPPNNPPSKHYPIITIDGISGVGKGTVAIKLAKALGYQFLDSGALYRIVALIANQAGLMITNPLPEDKIVALIHQLNIQFDTHQEPTQILVNDQPIGDEIRSETMGQAASKVAALPKVRQALLDLQRNMATQSGLIADGRDMGTVIFPHADVKIFLTASATARANRRVAQLKNMGETADFEHILTLIQERDQRDQERKVAPTRPAEDAWQLDTSNLTAEEVFAQVKHHCQSKGICFTD